MTGLCTGSIERYLVYLLAGCHALFAVVSAQCPSGQYPDGYYPDAANCNSYYECRNGVQVDHRSCANNLYWSVTSTGQGYCNTAQLVSCNTPCLQTSQSGTPSTVFSCPSISGTASSSANGFYGTNCDQYYYLCIDSKPFRYTCPVGMYWSNKVHTCNWKYLITDVDCSAATGNSFAIIKNLSSSYYFLMAVLNSSILLLHLI